MGVTLLRGVGRPSGLGLQPRAATALCRCAARPGSTALWRGLQSCLTLGISQFPVSLSSPAVAQQCMEYLNTIFGHPSPIRRGGRGRGLNVKIKLSRLVPCARLFLYQTVNDSAGLQYSTLFFRYASCNILTIFFFPSFPTASSSPISAPNTESST
jgi:hypothetical protein